MAVVEKSRHLDPSFYHACVEPVCLYCYQTRVDHCLCRYARILIRYPCTTAISISTSKADWMQLTPSGALYEGGSKLVGCVVVLRDMVTAVIKGRRHQEGPSERHDDVSESELQHRFQRLTRGARFWVPRWDDGHTGTSWACLALPTDRSAGSSGLFLLER